MDRTLSSLAAAAAVALALTAPAAATAAAPPDPPPASPAPAAPSSPTPAAPAPPAAAPTPAPAPPSAATLEELRDRRNLALEKELNERFGRLHLERQNEALGSLGFGLLASGGALWIASETDARGTWAVIVGHLAAFGLTDAVIQGATPDPAGGCIDAYREAPGDTPDALAGKVSLGERCLESAAQREASLRIARAFRDLALGASTVALWGTEPKQNRDRTLLWIAGVDGVFGLFSLVPGEAQRAYDGYRRSALDLRLAPAPTVDAAGRLAPGLGVAIRL